MNQIFLLLLCISLPAAARVEATLERNQIALGETVELTLQRDGRGGGDPDLSPLQRDFSILGRGSGSSIQFVNGRMSAQAQWHLTLAPKHGGHLQIPSLNWGGENSPALLLDVTGNGHVANSIGSHLLLEATLAQKHPYVQAATPLQVRIYTEQPLLQASLELAPSNDVLVQQVGQDKQHDEVRGGHHYRVIERDYLLFPQRSGHLSLPGPQLQAQIIDPRAVPYAADPFFGQALRFFGGNAIMNTRPLRLQGDAIELDVRPLPPGLAIRDWLPAQQVELEEQWGGARVRVGEPLSRHLRLTALGLTAAQLPDLAAMMPIPEGIKAYPDPAKLKTETQDDTVRGVRDQDIALIASRPGHLLFPELRLTWWDTRQNRARVAVLPARTLTILAAAGSYPPAVPSSVPPAASPMSPQAPSTSDAWPWLSLTLALLWLATLAAWWWSRRNSTRPPATVAPATRAAAHKDFLLACRDNDAAAARTHLLAWARATWPQNPFMGLTALAKRLEQPGLPDLLRDLDRACYAGGEWHGAALAAALPALQNKAAEVGAPDLPRLYP